MPCLGVAISGKVGRTIKSSESSMNTASELLSLPLEHTVLKKRKNCLANKALFQTIHFLKSIPPVNACITCSVLLVINENNFRVAWVVNPLELGGAKTKMTSIGVFLGSVWSRQWPGGNFHQNQSNKIKIPLIHKTICACAKVKPQTQDLQTNLKFSQWTSKPNLKTLARCLSISCFQPGS